MVGLTDAGGLDLALGYAVWCHYVPSDTSRIRDYVSESGIAVLAISEHSGLLRVAERLHVVGTEPARPFAPSSDQSLEPGDHVPAIA